MSERVELLGALLDGEALREGGFHRFDALLHPRGGHGHFATSGRAKPSAPSLSRSGVHDADAHLRAGWRASTERSKVHAAEQIIAKTRGMDTDLAAAATQAGKVKDTLAQHAPVGRIHPERERLHGKIIQHFLADTKPQAKPVAFFTAGGPASGKSALLGMAPAGAVHVDPDEIRKMLPEYGELKAKGRADIASSATHEEASHIASRIAAVAIQTKRHVVVDGTGDGELGRFAGKVAAARDAGHRTEVHYAHVATAEAERRERKRAARTGRHVPASVLRARHASVVQRYAEVAKLRGVTVKIHDNSGAPGAPLPLVWEKTADGRVKVHLWKRHREFLAKGRA